MSQTEPAKHFLVFDVESIGIHGEGYAVGALVCRAGSCIQECSFWAACDPAKAAGDDEDRKWIADNIPPIATTHETPAEVRAAFWRYWLEQKARIPNLVMAAECGWPVEARFLAACVDEQMPASKWAGPYPLHEVASFMEAAGMDVMATYERQSHELPRHHPLADARLSARLLTQAILALRGRTE